MPHPRAADVLVETLLAAGIERVFALSGNQIMPIFDACLTAGLEIVHTRHEAAAVHMADAWGRLTGRPGVALVTAGPGFANALSALYVAEQAESPLVLISGSAPLDGVGRGAFQAMPQAQMAGPVTRLSFAVAEAQQIGHDIARALRTARSRRPGPVHLAVPGELLENRLQSRRGAVAQPDDFEPLLSLLDARTAEDILDTLAKAERPLVLGGPHVCRPGGRELLARLQEVTHIPAFGMESPRGINDPSLGAIAEILPQADLVVLLGKRLDFSLRFGGAPAFAADCRFIAVDPETRILEEMARNIGDAQRLLIAEPADTLPALERLCDRAAARQWQRRDWCDEVAAAVAYRPAEWESLASRADGPLHPAEVCRIARDALRGDGEAETVFVSDGGEFGQWAQAIVSATERVINGPSGSIGGSVPFALAARLAFPEARLLVTLGDGTFGFHALEFDTAVRYGLPFVALVGNDACWNAERQIQLHDYGDDRLIGCDLLSTRYDEVVCALGGWGERVTQRSELAPALERAFASGQPACVNVHIEPAAAPVIRRRTTT
ncbi:MAG: thiamine pyrophosphate-binding protein [Planctomycetes bacterium]|nr:thiamine pyrophosphate-binding protein [Planctomycetota bacterium]